MDCLNNKETTVDCDNNNISKVTDENPRKSIVKSGNSDCSEFYHDEKILSDHWVDFNVDVDQLSANDICPRTADDIEDYEVEMSSSTKIPPNNNSETCAKIATQTFYSSKHKTETPEYMDKHVKNLDYNILYLNFSKLHQFLESDHEEMCFPFISKQYEEVFQMIAQDVNILKAKSLDAGYRAICDKIMYSANRNKSVYRLTSVYEYRNDFRDVLVFKKIYLKTVPVNIEPSLSSSMESLQPASEIATEPKPNKLPKSSRLPPTVSNGFKIHTLRATLAFVKNQVTNKIQFPELSSAQAEFMQLLLDSAISFNDFEAGIEIKDLYRSLLEAVKIFSLKYDFIIQCVESWSGKKTLVFEKILKQKSAEPSVKSNQMTISEFQNILRPRPGVPVDSKQILKPPPPVQSEKKTKQLKKKELKRQRIVDFVNKLPPLFVIQNLNNIINFLSVSDSGRLVFSPANEDEQKFYRNVIDWSRMTLQCSGLVFQDEHQNLFETIGLLLIRMICKVQKNGKSNFDCGTRQVTYVKRPKPLAPETTPNTSQSFNTEKNNKRKNSLNSDISTDRSVSSVGKSVSKKKKLKLQNVVNPDGTIEITVANPNGSLRKKKKNKKQKNANLDTSLNKLFSVGMSRKISFKPQQNRSDTDESDSERGISLDRKKRSQDTHRSTKETVDNIRSSIAERERRSVRGRRLNDQQRKEQLIEALSVPVQSDKAMKMMRGMGWSGGALGARGNGITEPIMPAIDIRTGAGLGHSNNSTKLAIRTKTTTTVPKPTGNWLAETPNAQTDTQNPDNDVVVQKTKQLLLENHSFDSLMKTDLNKPEFEYYKNCDFRKDVLKTVLELLSSDLTTKTLRYKSALPTKDKIFLRKATNPLVTMSKVCETILENAIGEQIMEKYKELPGVHIQFNISSDYKTVELIKTETFTVHQMKQLNNKPKLSPDAQGWATPINEADDNSIMAFIDSLRPSCKTSKSFKALKFRVLILLKILYFIKSDDQELEVTFNQELVARQKRYIHSTIDSVNSRMRFGNSAAESALTLEIKKYIHENISFGIMFNHRYTSFTLKKYNCINSAENNSKKRKITAIDLDDFSCDSSNEAPSNSQNNTVSINDTALDSNSDDVVIIENENKNNEVILIEDDGICEKDTVATDILNQQPTRTDEHISDNINKECAAVKSIKQTDTDTSGAIDKKNDETTDVKDNVNFFFNFQKNIDAADNKQLVAGAIKDGIFAISSINNKTDDENNSASFKASPVTGNGNIVIDNNDNQIIDIKNDILVNEDNKPDMIRNNAGHVVEEVCVKTKIISENEHIVPTNVKFDDKDDENTDIKVIVYNDDNRNVGLIKMEIDTVSIDTLMEEDLLKTEDLGDDDVSWSDDSFCNSDHSKNTYLEDVVMKEAIAKDAIGNLDEPMNEIINKDESAKVIDSVNTPFIENDIVAYNDVAMVTAGANVKDDICDDKVVNQNLVISEVHCDNKQLLGVSDFGKILNKDNNCEMQNSLLKNPEIKNVYIVPKNYPNVKMTKEMAGEVQKLISTNILKSTDLPLLMCHGVQNAALIYSCHNKKTYDWLKNVIVASQLKVLDAKDVQKMVLKFYCLFDFDSKYLFSMIELYNKGLSTKEWVVEKSEFHDDYVTFLVKMDMYSVNFIHASNLALFVGVDKVEFSLIWD